MFLRIERILLFDAYYHWWKLCVASSIVDLVIKANLFEWGRRWKAIPDSCHPIMSTSCWISQFIAFSCCDFLLMVETPRQFIFWLTSIHITRIFFAGMIAKSLVFQIISIRCRLGWRLGGFLYEMMSYAHLQRIIGSSLDCRAWRQVEWIWWILLNMMSSFVNFNLIFEHVEYTLLPRVGVLIQYVEKVNMHLIVPSFPQVMC